MKTTFDFKFLYQAFKQHGYTKIYKEKLSFKKASLIKMKFEKSYLTINRIDYRIIVLILSSTTVQY